MVRQPVVIVGAGPAGLCAGYELSKNGVQSLLFEKGAIVGGLARTETYRGFRFDVGGHRFYTKAPEVEQIWHEVRLSRIYYNGRFYNYPLHLPNTLKNLGLRESALILASYLKSQVQPHAPEETFEHWVTNRFGRRLYETFFKTYTEKVWGIPCSTIRADWAAQRIKGLSVRSAVTNALFRSNGVKSLIEEFLYPRQGPGMMWERMQQLLEARQSHVALETAVVKVKRNGRTIESITVQQKDGQTQLIQTDHLISSMPLSQLMLCMDPAPPPEILQAANSLNYRDFLIVVLLLDEAELFPDNWIYVHDPLVKVGRIQNFKNWSEEMVPDLGKTSLGMEYFCTVGDDIWSLSDEALIQLAARELEDLGLGQARLVEDGIVIRQRKAYPVYDETYIRHVQLIADYLESFTNLQTIGRNGMHRYNNQDHSMLTGLLAAQNILGKQHDLWQVNTERSYYEIQTVARNGRDPLP
ncbi:MAG: NAD(P)/FAD-dependent oxidoreductase [Anaerolineae bacterium]